MPGQLWDSTETNVIVSIDPWMMSDEYQSVISTGLQTMKYIVIASLLVVETSVQVTEHLDHKSVLSSTPCHAWEVILYYVYVNQTTIQSWPL